MFSRKHFATLLTGFDAWPIADYAGHINDLFQKTIYAGPPSNLEGCLACPVSSVDVMCPKEGTDIVH